VLEDFEVIGGQMKGMKSLTLDAGEQNAFAHAALALKYDTETPAAPVTETQILRAHRRTTPSSSKAPPLTGHERADHADRRAAGR
jgi:hypothetical protein